MERSPRTFVRYRSMRLGVDSAGKPTAYWQGLESFWTRYFHESGATLDSFSVLRELPLSRDGIKVR